MSQFVKKKVTISMCFGQNVVNGVFTDYSAPLYRKVTPERATTILRKLTGDDSITIAYIEDDTSTYEMPLSTFLKYAVTHDHDGEEL